MAISLGAFRTLDDHSFGGRFITLSIDTRLTIRPVDRATEKAPDHRVYTEDDVAIGAGWSRTGKESGRRFIQLRLAAPELGRHWLSCRLVELETPTEDGDTHLLLWEPADT
ncbi:DUF736 domain-containing protein [Marinivivus vitaminiproducens]|uniref:DUF736 domain-containing protein n=1 Tax=Marinivivus vitaminiproducens TaxID=3035935 RepID=UPI0027A4F8F3|nr:DUF736 domain-containing protein [Geminicoccaceae bacterium SCSIO 64248]